MPAIFTPRLRVFLETFFAASQTEGLGTKPEAREVPALSLAFDYGGTLLRASDTRTHFFVAHASPTIATVERDVQAEAAAARALESYGALDLRCLPDWEPAPDSEADYILPPQGGPHTFCSFTAAAVPDLRARGWLVDLAPDYPFRVVPPERAKVVAEIAEDDEKEDWFSLELGIDVDGRRLDLLPALLGWLDHARGDESIEALLHLPARFRAVPTSEGEYVVLPPERLVQMLRVLVELYQGRSGPKERSEWAFPGARAASIAKLDDALCWPGAQRPDWKGNTALLGRGRSLLRGPARANPPVEGLGAKLRPYQAEGVGWLAHLREIGMGGVLADDMGLGKTLQTIAHLLAERNAGRMDLPTLIVMPTSLVGNWRRELSRFAPSIEVGVLHGPKRHAERDSAMSKNVVLTTYPVLTRDISFFEEKAYHYVILDEAQAIKNRTSLAHDAVCRLRARHRLCLSGTPVENNLEELRSIFAFLIPDLLGDSTRFQDRFARPIEGGDADQLRVLREMVAPFLLRRMKEQVATDLPPKTELVHFVELRGEQRELYESIRLAAHADVRKAIRVKGFAASSIAILDALMKLRQVCCDPRLLTVQAASTISTSAKLEALLTLLTAQLHEKRRVLVFSQFTSMLAIIAQELEARGVPYLVLTGGTSDRQKVIDGFVRGDADVFLISLKAGGTGLNLTRADTVIHYDPWWNPAAQGQATDRAYRIGQTRPVFVYNLVVSGSVEERMLRLQQRKRQLAESILGNNGGAVGPMSPQDVDGLFAPLA